MNVRLFTYGTLAAGALALASTAQTATTPVQGPITYATVHYDLATGQVTPLIQQHPNGTVLPRGVFPQQVAIVSCYENNDFSGSFAAPLPGEEWVDWGVKDCGASGIVESIQIGYGTSALDTSMGGPGAALQLALYEGTAGAAPELGTEIIRFDLVGLPGSATGAPEALVVDVLFSAPSTPGINWGDGKIGYGFVSLDGVSGPLLINVGPSAFGPDTFGYEADTAMDGFMDILATGADAGLAGIDDGGATVPIGFDFDFYGTTITEISACTNGYLTTGGDLSDFTPDCIPSGTDPNGLIAPMFQDLSLADHGTILYETIGDAPCRKFVVQWEDAGGFDNSAASITMQAVLNESTNAIDYHYNVLVDGPTLLTDGSDAAVGIENDDASDGLSISCGVNVTGGADSGTLVVGQSYRITIGRENPNGTVDAFNRYAAPADNGNFIGTAFFIDPVSGASIDRASFWMVIREEDGTCAAASQGAFGVPANPDILTSATLPILGNTWVGDIDVSGFPSPVETILLIAKEFNACSGSGSCPTAFGDLLIDPATIVFVDSAAPAGGLSQHFIDVTKILDKCGSDFHLQAVVVDPGTNPVITLTNAIDVVLGF